MAGKGAGGERLSIRGGSPEEEAPETCGFMGNEERKRWGKMPSRGGGPFDRWNFENWNLKYEGRWDFGGRLKIVALLVFVGWPNTGLDTSCIKGKGMQSPQSRQVHC